MTHTEHVQITEHAALAYDIPDGMTLCPGCAGTGCANCQSSGLIAAIRHDAAAEYDRYLLDRARELSRLCSHAERARWLTEHGTEFEQNLAIDGDHGTVYAAIHGRLAAVTAELIRWLDRIPEANRG